MPLLCHDGSDGTTSGDVGDSNNATTNDDDIIAADCNVASSDDVSSNDDGSDRHPQDFRTHLPMVWIDRELKLECLMDGQTRTKDSPDIQEIANKARQMASDIKNVLGLVVGNLDDVAIVQKLLRHIGHDMKRRRRQQNKVQYYEFIWNPPQDRRQDYFQYWQQSYVERRKHVWKEKTQNMKAALVAAAHESQAEYLSEQLDIALSICTEGSLEDPDLLVGIAGIWEDIEEIVGKGAAEKILAQSPLEFQRYLEASHREEIEPPAFLAA